MRLTLASSQRLTSVRHTIRLMRTAEPRKRSMADRADPGRKSRHLYPEKCADPHTLSNPSPPGRPEAPRLSAKRLSFSWESPQNSHAAGGLFG